MLANDPDGRAIPRRRVPAVALALTGLLAALAPGPAGAQTTQGLAPLLDASGLKYLMHDETTAVVLVRTSQDKVRVVTVRVREGVLAVFSEIIRAEGETVPVPLWKKVAEVNARPSLAHVGYVEAQSTFHAVSGLPDPQQATGEVLRAMILEVAGLADEMEPVLRDLLEVQ